MKTGTLEKIQDGEGKIWYGGGVVVTRAGNEELSRRERHQSWRERHQQQTEQKERKERASWWKEEKDGGVGGGCERCLAIQEMKGYLRVVTPPRASRLLRTCLIIPCHLVNAICPTFFFSFFFFISCKRCCWKLFNYIACLSLGLQNLLLSAEHK